jgi:peptidoglycan/xylan/chitin deacetylase (PgdA/CDA1 family)
MKTAQALPIFMYHHVSPAPGLVTVSPATFRAHMAALAQAGWQTVGLNEVAAFLRGDSIPARSCVLTFDDGYLDNYVHAHPALVEFGLKAVLFLVTGWLGEGPARPGAKIGSNHAACMQAVAAGEHDRVMLRWTEVESMQRAGTFEFHSHTHTHQRWDRLLADPVERRDALAADLQQSRVSLVARLGSTTSHLCWPQGYHDERYRNCARQSGFSHLYTTEKRVVTPGSDTSQIGRIVAKEKSGDWLTARARIFASPWLGATYSWLQKH